MPVNPVQSDATRWAVVCTIVALASVYAFLQDIISPDWPAWVLSPLIVVGFRSAVKASPDDSVMRAALYQVALLLVPFMGVYGLVDAATSVDWPQWVIAPAVVAVLWAGVATITEAEAD
jgi:hypothetical protein